MVEKTGWEANKKASPIYKRDIEDGSMITDENCNPILDCDFSDVICYIIGYYLYQEIEAVENYKKYVRERESRLAMLYEMKEKYKKIYGMQAAVVLNLMHQGKDLLAFMK